MVVIPLMLILPVNCEPLNADSTLNPNSGETDAVTEPDVNSVLINA